MIVTLPLQYQNEEQSIAVVPLESFDKALIELAPLGSKRLNNLNTIVRKVKYFYQTGFVCTNWVLSANYEHPKPPIYTWWLHMAQPPAEPGVAFGVPPQKCAH